MKVKTIAYSDSKTLTPEKLQENHEFNEKSNYKIIYYYIVDDTQYIIHGKYKNEIYNNIYGLVKNLSYNIFTFAYNTFYFYKKYYY